MSPFKESSIIAQYFQQIYSKAQIMQDFCHKHLLELICLKVVHALN